MAGRGRWMTAAQAAELPEHLRPAWYRPARGKGQGGPAKPYAEGNVVNLGAGYRSARVYSHVSAALITGLIETRPDLAAYPEALAAWSDAEARVALLRKHLDEHGMIDDDGEMRANLLRELDRFENRAAKARTVLGLDPRSEAELSLLRGKALREGVSAQATASTLEALAATGREVLEAGNGDPVLEALERVRAEAAAGDGVTGTEHDEETTR